MRNLIPICLATAVAATFACTDPAEVDDLGLDEQEVTTTCVGAIDDDWPMTTTDTECRLYFGAFSASVICDYLMDWRAAAEADCAAGRLRRYRINNTSTSPGGKHHLEDTFPFDFGDGDTYVLEGNFVFATTPQPGAPAAALYRCINNNDNADDYLVRSSTCNGNGTVRSWSGYTFAPGTPDAVPVYRCLRNTAPTDHYLSRDPTCGGNTVEANLGYVK